MANYVITDYTVVKPRIEEVAAAFETYLETLDSTTQAAQLIKILPTKDGQFEGIILHLDSA
jgi:fructose-1-phosphate kinase PfkB-like protein